MPASLSPPSLPHLKPVLLRLQRALPLEPPDFLGEGAAIHVQIVCQLLPVEGNREAAASVSDRLVRKIGQEAAPDGSEASVDELKAMVARATSDLLKATSAREGDKTMMDAFVAAGEAAATCEGDELDLLDDIADAAEAGAEATKDQVAKYGPARNLGEASRGIADPGAVAVAHFLRGLSRA